MDEPTALEDIYAATDAVVAEATAAATAEGSAAEESAAPESETAVVETDESEEAAEESTDESAEETDIEPELSEDFSDLLSDIPTTESLLNEHKRVPTATKEALTSLAEGWRLDREKLDAIGGADAVEVLKPLAQVLTSAEPDEQSRIGAWSQLYAANPETAMLMMMDVSEFLMNDSGDPRYKAIAEKGDVVLERVFGRTAEHIRDLIKLEEGGYVDVKNDLTLLQSEGTGSSLYKKLEDKLAESTLRINELTRLVENPELIGDNSAPLKAMESELNKRITEGIAPFRERGKWTEDSKLTQIALRGIMAELKESDEYKNASTFVRQFGQFDADKMPLGLRTALNTLVRKATGRFGDDVISINKEWRERSQTSDNAVVKEKVDREVKPKAEPISTESQYWNGSIPLDPNLAKIYQTTDSVVREAAKAR